MAEPVFTKEHLAKMIDLCIEDINTGGSKLFDLAHLFHCLGEIANKSVYDSFASILGSFGGEIITFRPYVMLPILPEETRSKFQRIFNEAIDSCKRSLRIIKEELCEKDSYDPNRILEALSLIGKHDYTLTEARTNLMRIRSSLSEGE